MEFGIRVQDSARRQDISQVLDFLRPKPQPFDLMRVGGNSDGAYLLPNDLEGISRCFSPGVGDTKIFEDDLLDKFGIESSLLDYSVTGMNFSRPLVPGKQSFRKKWLSVEAGKDNITIERWIFEESVEGDLILQMDIEGAEYENILGTSSVTLRKFRIIVVELHGVAALMQSDEGLGKLVGLARHLDGAFMVCHVHANNAVRPTRVPGAKALVSDLLEVTLLRRDRVDNNSALFIRPKLPHKHDIYSNLPGRKPAYLGKGWADRGNFLRTLRIRARHWCSYFFVRVRVVFKSLARIGRDLRDSVYLRIPEKILEIIRSAHKIVRRP
jgi:hypothetical protein